MGCPASEKMLFLRKRNTMEIVSILILFLLSFQVMPVALGIDIQKTSFIHITGSVVFLVLGQLLLFLTGIWLGNRFMHLVSGINRYILFVGFFLIAVRFSMEAFRVRKGERTYVMGKSVTYILPAVAQAVNTFLAGILFYFLPLNLSSDIIYLALFSFVFSVLFAFIKNKTLALPAISLLYMTGGGLLILISFYFLFF